MIVGLVLLALAQEGTLDVLDGETLYEEGWLFTAGYERETREGLLDGRDSVSDPLDRRQLDETISLAAHYGLRYNVQLSAILPYVRRTLSLDSSGGPDEFSSDGLGDLALVGKWRFHRSDAPGVGTNYAVLAGVELPTGSDDEKDSGLTLPPELQPGSGSFNPSIGAAMTHEPGRWRFNTAALYYHGGENSDDFKRGDRFFLELAAGNRFWLEPYPGPFMRFDVLLRYRHQWRSTLDGDIEHDSGGDLVTLGGTLAFRPRPSLDVQLFLELPMFQRLQGIQLEEDLSMFLTFGLRI